MGALEAGTSETLWEFILFHFIISSLFHIHSPYSTTRLCGSVEMFNLIYIWSCVLTNMFLCHVVTHELSFIISNLLPSSIHPHVHLNRWQERDWGSMWDVHSPVHTVGLQRWGQDKQKGLNPPPPCLVFKGLVRSSLSTPRAVDRDQDWSTSVQRPQKTAQNWRRPVLIGFLQS